VLPRIVFTGYGETSYYVVLFQILLRIILTYARRITTCVPPYISSDITARLALSQITNEYKLVGWTNNGVLYRIGVYHKAVCTTRAYLQSINVTSRSCCVLMLFVMESIQNTSRLQRECFGIFLDFLEFILFFRAISIFWNIVKNIFTSYIWFFIHPIPIYL
jgi:hypothetical protein